MSLVATLVFIVNLFFDTAGHLAFKAASLDGSDLETLSWWKKVFRNPFLWIGILAYIFEFAAWLAFLSLVPLSLAILVGCISILTVTIGGRLIFKEKLTPFRVAGISLIAIGVLMTGWS